MDYRSCAEARDMAGVRLVLSVGGPNPWGEAAKAVFHVRQVDYVAVGRVGMDDDPEIFEWTGVRNVPVAMYNDEKPRHSWIDILYLAERVGKGPSLLPSSRALQVESIGLSHQLCGENGLGWTRRLTMFDRMVAQAGGDISKTGIPARLFKDYTINPETMAESRRTLLDLLALFDARLTMQKAAGSRYLVGQSLTATDLHFATIFGMMDPLPHALNPMSDQMRAIYGHCDADIRAAVTDQLLAHRDYIYQTYLTLPMDF